MIKNFINELFVEFLDLNLKLLLDNECGFECEINIIIWFYIYF